MSQGGGKGGGSTYASAVMPRSANAPAVGVCQRRAERDGIIADPTSGEDGAATAVLPVAAVASDAKLWAADSRPVLRPDSSRFSLFRSLLSSAVLRARCSGSFSGCVLMR